MLLKDLKHFEKDTEREGRVGETIGDRGKLFRLRVVRVLTAPARFIDFLRIQIRLIRAQWLTLKNVKFHYNKATKSWIRIYDVDDIFDELEILTGNHNLFDDKCCGCGYKRLVDSLKSIYYANEGRK